MEEIQQEAVRGTRHDYPVIVLNSPSTPSYTGSTEDTYSNRVYTTTVVRDTTSNEYFYEDYDYEDHGGGDAEYDKLFSVSRTTHSKDNIESDCL